MIGSPIGAASVGGGFSASDIFPVGAGAFSLTGETITGFLNFVAPTGSFSLSGSIAGMTIWIFPFGSYSVTGIDVSFPTTVQTWTVSSSATESWVEQSSTSEIWTEQASPSSVWN